MTSPTGRLQSVWTTDGNLRLHTRISVDSVPPSQIPIWLVHGLSVSSRYMVPTGVRLAPYYRVYAPDLPGFGKSDDPQRVLNVSELADALLQRMDTFGVERAVMIGNSLGCQIIVDAAVRYPERIAQAVLVGPTMDPNGRTMLEQARRLFIDGVCYESYASVITQAMDYMRCGPRRTLATLRYALDDRIEAKLPRVSAPTLVVRGEDDPIVPEGWAEEVTDLLPDGRLVVLRGAPHAANYDSSAALVRSVLSFLEYNEFTQAKTDLALDG